MNTFQRTGVKPSGSGHQGPRPRLLAILVMLALCQLVIVPAGWAKEERSQDTASEAGLGVASVFLSIPYGAAKVAYAILGGITGGFTYVLTGGNLKAAEAVWDTSLRGTYIITPEHLRGEKPVRFFGVPPEGGGSRTSQGIPPADSAPASDAKPAPGPPSASSEMIPSGPAPAMQSGPASTELTR